MSKRKPGRPKGSGLGKYNGEKAKNSSSVRKGWRDYYHQNKKKERRKK